MSMKELLAARNQARIDAAKASNRLLVHVVSMPEDEWTNDDGLVIARAYKDARAKATATEGAYTEAKQGEASTTAVLGELFRGLVDLVVARRMGRNYSKEHAAYAPTVRDVDSTHKRQCGLAGKRYGDYTVADRDALQASLQTELREENDGR